MRFLILIFLLPLTLVGQTIPMVTNLPSTTMLTNRPPTAMRPSINDVNSGLVSYWPFTNASLADVVGPNSGTQPGSAVTSNTGPSGIANGSMLFSGVSTSFVVCGNDVSTKITGDVSGTFWMNPSFSSGTSYPVLWRVFAGSTGGWPSTYAQIFNSINFFWESGNGVSANFDDVSATTPVNNTWTFVVTTRSGKVNTIYYNGVQSAQKTFTATLPYTDGATTLNIGGDATTSPAARFTGSLCGVRLYNRALTAAEIQQLYSNGVNRKFF